MKAKSLKKVVSVLAAMTMLVVCFSAFTAVFAADTVIWNAGGSNVNISNPTDYESTLDFTSTTSGNYAAYITAPNFKPIETGKIAFDFTYEPFTDTNTINASENVWVSFFWANASNATSSGSSFGNGAAFQFIATSTTQLKVRFYLGNGSSPQQKKEDATTYKVGQTYHIVYDTVEDAGSATGYTTTVWIDDIAFYTYETPSGMITNYTTQGSGLAVKPYNAPTITINAQPSTSDEPEITNKTNWLAAGTDASEKVTITGEGSVANIQIAKPNERSYATAYLSAGQGYFRPVAENTLAFDISYASSGATGSGTNMHVTYTWVNSSNAAASMASSNGNKLALQFIDTANGTFKVRVKHGSGGALTTLTAADVTGFTMGETYRVMFKTVADSTAAAGYTTHVFFDGSELASFATPSGQVSWFTGNANCGLVLGPYTGNYDADFNLTIDTAPELPAEPVETFDFDAVSLSLKDNIAINFKADVAWFDGTNASYTNPYVEVTDEDNNVTTIDTYTVRDGKYVFTYDKIAAKMMGDVVSAVLYANGGEVESDVLEYSVKQYCKDQENTTDAALKTLLADMLVYGAAAQTYDGYKTNALVTAGMDVSAATSATPTMNSVTDITTGTVDNATATWKAASLFLEESVTMRFKFTTTENINNVTVKVTNAGGGTLATIDTFAWDGTRYIADFNEFNPAQMRDTVNVTVYSNGTAVSETLTYSIESYAAAKQDSATAGLSDLVIAMMKYGDSTAALA